MKVKDFKNYVTNIPDEYNDLDITLCQFDWKNVAIDETIHYCRDIKYIALRGTNDQTIAERNERRTRNIAPIHDEPNRDSIPIRRETPKRNRLLGTGVRDVAIIRDNKQ